MSWLAAEHQGNVSDVAEVIWIACVTMEMTWTVALHVVEVVSETVYEVAVFLISCTMEMILTGDEVVVTLTLVRQKTGVLGWVTSAVASESCDAPSGASQPSQ